MRPAPPHRQRGVAVITALLLTTLAITIVASLFWQQQVQVRSIENQRLQLQKQLVLRGALDWAGLILREDAKHSSVDNLDEPWATPLAETRLDQYVENGRADDAIADATLSGGISDAQARYNLTNLCPDGTINPAEVAVFARLLGNVQLNPALAQATADLMAAALNKSETAGHDNQPRDNQPRDNQPRPQPMNLAHVDDLLAVPGFTPQMIGNLDGFVIFLPRATPVNVNTAPAEVLAAIIDELSLPDAVTLVESRNTASFRNLKDFTHRLPGKSISETDINASVSSNFFLVNGKVRMNRASLDMQALIERTGPSTKLIRIREY
ncbi:MAG: type II secretion system minor pseudopilin GspK [Gallionella sp.]|nr:type II secretion system minor pseudopilin GspK [Gallionella sp.]